MSEINTVNTTDSALRLRSQIVRRRIAIILTLSLILLVVLAISVLSQGSTSMKLLIKPDTITSDVEVERNKGILFVFDESVLMFSDSGEINVSAEGYRPVTQEISKPTSENLSREIEIELEPLPGIVSIAVRGPSNYSAFIDGVLQQNEMLSAVELHRGEYELVIQTTGAQTIRDTLVIDGLGQRQDFEYELVELFGELSLSAEPSEATITIDGEDLGTGTYQGKLGIGDHTVQITAADHERYSKTVRIEEDQLINLGHISLRIYPAYLTVETEPAQATVIFDGVTQGKTDVRIEVPPNIAHSLVIEKPHYRKLTDSIHLKPKETITRRFELKTH